MKKIVTIIAGLTITLSLVAETNTNNNIIYVKNEIIKAVNSGTDLYVAREKTTSTKAKTSNSGSSQSGIASYYGKGLHGSRTASGERHNRNEMVAAHKSLPFGTKVKVTNLSNGKEVVVKINDRGPFVKGRVIDLSYGAFSKIENPGKGITKVKLDILK
ncbi:septal ring lytic transglycosylase RlpA family protein [Leptotrichia massiliensis]|jgi:rare lipoprotein A|uniref:septal ring lytic transglycosylase RlpA family protein n=1 Tax=Leptotrichia massiliensis TaxID=1852388 RepID=UPI0028D2731D|nr:septal ring lytic transglycosylase RlpA family protein [Leptotrichia massiliensis]